jgi:phosphoribosyl-AMP cyclohydrolase
LEFNKEVTYRLDFYSFLLQAKGSFYYQLKKIKEGVMEEERVFPDRKSIEMTTYVGIDFEKLKKVVACDRDVIPVVVQDAETKDVLILAYANEQALAHSLRTGMATFWSTSKNQLWVKGLTSGSYLELLEVRVNCEQNSLLYMVRSKHGACHVKMANGQFQETCFYRRFLPEKRLLLIRK